MVTEDWSREVELPWLKKPLMRGRDTLQQYESGSEEDIANVLNVERVRM